MGINHYWLWASVKGLRPIEQRNATSWRSDLRSPTVEASKGGEEEVGDGRCSGNQIEKGTILVLRSLGAVERALWKDVAVVG